MPVTRLVTGPLLLGDGNPAADALIEFVLDRSETDTGTGEAIARGLAASAITDANGDFSVNLWPTSRGARGGRYLIRGQLASGFTLDQVSATLAEGNLSAISVADVIRTSQAAPLGAEQLVEDLEALLALGTTGAMQQIAAAEVTAQLEDLVVTGDYTDEMARDAIAAMIAAGTHSGISFTPDDAGNSLSATVSGGGGGTSYYDLLGGFDTISTDGYLDSGIIPRAVSFALASSYIKADTNPTATATVTIKKNGASVGTLTLSSAGVKGSTGFPLSFAAGDKYRLELSNGAGSSGLVYALGGTAS
jgi:hypothetical protein